MNPRDVVAAYLVEAGVDLSQDGGDVFAFALHGENKHSLPVTLELRERTLALSAFFLRRPLENLAAVYEMLLARNARSGPVRFATDVDGDVYLMADLPIAVLNADALDALLGVTLSIADEMFPRAVEVGFATYLARDRAWRDKAGAPSVEDEHPSRKV